MDILFFPTEYKDKAILRKFDGELVDSIGDYEVYAKEATNRNHYLSKHDNVSNKVYVLWGNLYCSKDTSKNMMFENIIMHYENNSLENIFEVDGEFIFACIDENGINILSDREGIMPIYYRIIDDKCIFTSRCELLFLDYTEDDIDTNSINDFLRFGCLIGDRTMSKKVKLLQGGSIARYINHKFFAERIYKFYYQEPAENVDKLIDDVVEAYRSAIKKRIDGIEQETCVFLSGGMDSRFLLAEMNKVTTDRVHTYSFGQVLSEEVNVARECAALENNPFSWIKVDPKDFVINASEYERMVCGADMFPQSYIIEAAKQIDKSHFITGFALDAYMGGTFLNEEAIKTDEKLSGFIKDNLKLAKMNVFSKNELEQMCSNQDAKKIFSIDIEDLVREAERYDDIPVANAIQAFSIDNRAKHVVLWREIVPAKFLDCSYVSADRDFLKLCSKIPAEWRLNHKFYHKLFVDKEPEFAKIAYNNTTLPVLAPVEKWDEGTRNESRREKQYEEIIREYNLTHLDKMYYTHFYSDFNGYSRYDEAWQNLFQKYLLSEDSIVCRKWFDREYINKLYAEHLSGEKNRRKELTYLTSIEVFLRNMLVSK